MIAEIKRAEWRESKVSDMPYLALELELESGIYIDNKCWLFISPRAHWFFNQFLKMCCLPTWDRPYEDVNFRPIQCIGKLLSIYLERIDMKDRHYWVAKLNIESRSKL